MHQYELTLQDTIYLLQSLSEALLSSADLPKKDLCHTLQKHVIQSVYLKIMQTINTPFLNHTARISVNNKELKALYIISKTALEYDAINNVERNIVLRKLMNNFIKY
ncbi:hypothetical protein COB57_04955 [Candidatus Peregrinibacteria bacterium]|nr:MAG: hypothetical protein COB57_04955 [Candidatus Peregrinibacteria bacterium]